MLTGPRTILFAIWLALLLPAAAAPLVIDGDHEKHILQGQGRDFVIKGHHLKVVITGRSGLVRIDGHHHKVIIESANVIELNGHHNKITFQGEPRLVRNGSKNIVARGDGGLADRVVETREESRGEEVVVSGAGQNLTYEGGNRRFVVAGSGNKVRIRGRAAVLTLSGSGNSVDIDEAGLIKLTGVDNHAVFRRGNPRVDESGIDNSCSRR